MRRIFNTVTGSLLILAAIVGIVFSIAGIVSLGALQARVASGVEHQLALLDQALTATDAGLGAATTSLAQSQAALTSITATINGSANAVDDIVPAVESMSQVVGQQLPATLVDATQALTTFAETATVIDGVMTVLGSLPLINVPAYDPDVPLSESVTGFRDSLGELGGKLQDIQAGLDKTAGNLQEVRGEVSGVGAALDGLGESLNGAVAVLASYQDIVDDLRTQVDTVSGSIEDALRWARIVATVALLWLGIASLGLLTQGWELLHRNRKEQAAPAE